MENFHVDNRKKDGLRSRCKMCELEKAAKYRESKRELLACKQRAYYDKSGDIQRKASNNWKSKNKEHVSNYMSKWHKSNRDNRLEYHKQYSKDNPESVIERSRKRRAIIYSLDEHFTEKQFIEKFNSMGNKCYYCDIELSEKIVTRDHYIPITKGGTDTIENIVPCCSSCNSRKYNTMPNEFILKFGNPEPSKLGIV